MRRIVFVWILSLAMLAVLVPCAGAASVLPEGVPSSLAAAVIDQVQVLKDEDGVPYFQMEVQFPQSFLDLSETRPAGGYTWIDYYWKIDGGSWEYLSGGQTDCLLDESYGNAVSGKVNTYRVTGIYPESAETSDAIIVSNHLYTLRVRLAYVYRDDSPEANTEEPYQFIYSAFSNEVSIGSGSHYVKVSDWVKPELQKAEDLSLVPDILTGSDLTKPITREEFCELAVLLYEKATGSVSVPASPNPFTDTDNPQILKAYRLGITTGTTPVTFSPGTAINREQCAAMLFRAIRAIKPNGVFDISGVKDFPDQKDISSWAVQAAKYMSRVGILTGNTKGYFMPKATTAAQQAAGYGMATREQAIALSVRTYEKLPSLS